MRLTCWLSYRSLPQGWMFMATKMLGKMCACNSHLLAVAAAPRAHQIIVWKPSRTASCTDPSLCSLDLVQRNKKRGGLRDDELHFDRICFNFPHIGLGIKDQVIAMQCMYVQKIYFSELHSHQSVSCRMLL